MSEHKTSASNWTEKQKTDYRDRRGKGLRGQASYANTFATVKDEEGKDQLLPIGFTRGPGRSSRLTSGGSNKAVDRRFTKKNHGDFVRARTAPTTPKATRPYASKEGAGR